MWASVGVCGRVWGEKGGMVGVGGGFRGIFERTFSKVWQEVNGMK